MVPVKLYPQIFFKLFVNTAFFFVRAALEVGLLDFEIISILNNVNLLSFLVPELNTLEAIYSALLY